MLFSLNVCLIHIKGTQSHVEPTQCSCHYSVVTCSKIALVFLKTKELRKIPKLNSLPVKYLPDKLCSLSSVRDREQTESQTEHDLSGVRIDLGHCQQHSDRLFQAERRDILSKRPTQLQSEAMALTQKHFNCAAVGLFESLSGHPSNPAFGDLLVNNVVTRYLHTAEKLLGETSVTISPDRFMNQTLIWIQALVAPAEEPEGAHRLLGNNPFFSLNQSARHHKTFKTQLVWTGFHRWEDDKLLFKGLAYFKIYEMYKINFNKTS